MNELSQLSMFDGAEGLATPSSSGSSLSVRFRIQDSDGAVIRQVERRDRAVVETLSSNTPSLLNASGQALSDEFDSQWLRSKQAPPWSTATDTVKLADLFCGCGGLSLGLSEACRAIGYGVEVAYALDNDVHAIDVYRANLSPALIESGDIQEVLDGEIGGKVTQKERALLAQLAPIDILIGGPPCQGHSDLNNHTRRNDPRNRLILSAVRFAELTSPSHVVLENVQGTAHDRTGSVKTAVEALTTLGYSVSTGLLSALDVGVAQSRRRFFIVGTRGRPFSFSEAIKRHRSTPRTFDWACGDLKVDGEVIFESAARHSAENQRRINYLHDHNLHELPNAERPDCHRLKAHGYNSVYGRLWSDRPSPTVTTGFGSTGQGRFVHPRERRTLTPHEAARLQFFPDFFDFGVRGRRAYQKLIGNAVPPKLGYVIGIELLR